jgi:predicted DNA-binding transcriptional regulator AlpA
MSSVLVFDSLPDDAFLRQSQLVKSPKRTGFSILPFSSATLWRMVKVGTFPRPVKVTNSITAWRAGEVRAWLRQHQGEVPEGGRS